MRKFAKTHKLAVIVVNILTSGRNKFRRKGQPYNQIPALGKLWRSIPTDRFILSKEIDNFAVDNSLRKIQIVKSSHLKIGNYCKLGKN